MMDSVAQRLRQIRSILPAGVELVAVSKFQPIELLRQAYEAGQRRFGESRVQELQMKVGEMPTDVEWHFIGHLQTNKVRALLRLRPAMIESVDSEHLLEVIDAEAVRQGVIQCVLMQVHVAAEETKFGFTPEELIGYFEQHRYRDLKAVHVCGVMGMATNTSDTERVCADFEAIAGVHHQIVQMCPDLCGFSTVSMGMSDDYPLAISCGSTLVRVGTAIFGHR